jgi:tRNA(Ile)-lysidine synthase
LYVSGSPLEPLSREPALLLAVSGGPDSTALLLMAAEWATGRPTPELFAATVDHGLRTESAAEAERVSALAARLGVPHATLVWEGEKPSARLQERAREARYALLVAQARAVGARVVVTAHHLDDQAETVLMRLTRGSGLSGLAGMAARSRRGELDIARPLLTVSKAELVAFCQLRGVAYARDPSNTDPRFARPRLRAIAETLAAGGLDAPALARLARRAATVEAALTAKTAEAEARLWLIETGRCDARALAEEPAEIVRRLLTLAVAKVSKADAARLPLEAMERIADDVVRAANASERYAANVAGVLIVCEADSEVRVVPEPPRRTGAAPVKQE